jgi:lipopolysaccharide transport system permease protein
MIGSSVAASIFRPTSIIEAPGLSPWAYLKSVWRDRYLIGPLCYHSLAVTYQSTILGWWWLIIRATLPTLGLIAVFQHVTSLQPENLPYPLHVVSGMALWTILGVGLGKGTRCMRISRRIQSRRGFPKILAVVSAMALPGVYALGFLMLLLGGIGYYYFIYGMLFVGAPWRFVLFPVGVMLALLLTIGITSFTSVLFLVAKDIRMLIHFLVQSWFYFTPIAYPKEVLPESWRTAVMFLNPMASLTELTRWSLLGAGTLDLPSLLTSSAICLGAFWLGMRFIARAEVAVPVVRLI